MPAVTDQSTVPDFGIALKAALEAQLATDGLSAVSVCDGPPPPNVLDLEEYVAIGDVDVDVEVRGLNRTTQPRKERYVQHLDVNVQFQSQSDQPAASARAFAIYESLHTLLRGNVALAGSYAGPGAINAARVSAARLTKRADTTVRESNLHVEITVQAQL
jgi:hypothetical protein